MRLHLKGMPFYACSKRMGREICRFSYDISDYWEKNVNAWHSINVRQCTAVTVEIAAHKKLLSFAFARAIERKLYFLMMTNNLINSDKKPL